MPHKRLRALRTIALCLVGAVTLSIGSATLTHAQPKDMTLEHIKGSNQELVTMLEQTNPDTFLGYKDIIITQEQFDEIGAKAVEVVAGITSEYDKAVKIQQWVHNHIAYDYDNSVKDQNAYTAFIEKEGICQAYSNLTKAMLSYLNIPCILVNGDSSAGGHAWNMAYVDGSWMFIDSTWGGTSTDVEAFSKDHKPYFSDSLQEVEGDYTFTYHNGVAVCEYRGTDTNWNIPDTFRGVPTTALAPKLFNNTNLDKVETISFPATLKNIDNVTDVFQRFTGLKEFQVAEGNTSFATVSGALFDYDKTQLLAYPAANQQEAFQVPDTVTTLGECAFQNNPYLAHVLIPASVTNLGKDVFNNKQVIIYTTEGSAAAQYAESNGMTVKDISEFPQAPEPSPEPTVEPTVAPTVEPTVAPTVEPTVAPTVEPTVAPTVEPTVAPTVEPTVEPTVAPTVEPTVAPTVEPTVAPTVEPTVAPTVEPTVAPSQNPSQDVILNNNSGVQISMNNASQAFDQGTVVVVDAITQGEIYQRVQAALKGVAQTDQVAVFEITATQQGQATQPQVPVNMVFQIPSHLSLDNLKLFYVAANGQREEIPITVDAQARTATASLSHFSTYVLANTAVTDNQEVPSTGDSQMIVFYAAALLVAAGLMVSAEVARKRYQK